MYLHDDDNSLPGYFWNAFAWRGVYMPLEESDTSLPSGSSKPVYTMAVSMAVYTTFSWTIQRLQYYDYCFERLSCYTSEKINKQKKQEARPVRLGFFAQTANC